MEGIKVMMTVKGSRVDGAPGRGWFRWMDILATTHRWMEGVLMIIQAQNKAQNKAQIAMDYVRSS